MSRALTRNLGQLLEKSSGWQKGLLVAANEAQRCVYNRSSLCERELWQIRDSINTEGEGWQYNAVLDAEQELRAAVANIQTRHLALRERLATLRGFFVLFKQHRLFADLLNYALHGEEDGVRIIRERVLSGRSNVLAGEFAQRADDENAPSIEIAASDNGKKVVYELIDKIAEDMRELKRRISEARRFMIDNALLLKPYEDYLDYIEDELRDLIRFTKSVFYCSTSETWPLERAALVEMDDEHLKLMEALPDY